MMVLRTVALDDGIREAVAGGARQLVILGAGLDGRAFRQQELSGVDVFEVDHPDTQASKRERSVALARTCRSLRFVPLNFERASLDRALEDAGHRPSEPTVWLWKGVVMYLRDEAVRSTLRVVASRSAPGSTLLVQYIPREGRDFLTGLLMRLWSEPQVGLRSPGEMASELASAGFRVTSDSGIADWASSRGARAPSMKSARRSRIVVARL